MTGTTVAAAAAYSAHLGCYEPPHLCDRKAIPKLGEITNNKLSYIIQ